MESLLFKKIRPTTSSQRGLKQLYIPFLGNLKPLKRKTFFHLRKKGHNHKGLITIRHRGGGHKKLYRAIDFKKHQAKGIVEAIEHDPFRSAFIARLFDEKSNIRSYILAPKNLCVGALIKSGEGAEIRLGHSLPLTKIPVGSLLHNVSTSAEKKGQYARSAGAFAQLVQKTKDKARIRLPSGEQRLIPLNTCASIGCVSNENYKLTTIGKAGRNRWYGIRPHVRGVAMNPVDHPHGGGEGKSSGGRPSVTPWAKPTRGQKTSRSRNPSTVVSRIKN